MIIATVAASIGLAIIVAGLLRLATAHAGSQEQQLGFVVVLSGVVVALVSVNSLLWARTVLRCRMAEGNQVWLNGAGKAFLISLGTMRL
jgi:hypothetical protein